MLPCFTVNIISSAGDGFVRCGGVFLAKGVLISSPDRESVDTSPPTQRVFTAAGRVLGAGVPVGHLEMCLPSRKPKDLNSSFAGWGLGTPNEHWTQPPSRWEQGDAKVSWVVAGPRADHVDQP